MSPALEKITGEPLDVALQENALGPLGLDHLRRRGL
jgi:CubicO group peptidase (beta-lactamase class C family)